MLAIKSVIMFPRRARPAKIKNWPDDMSFVNTVIRSRAVPVGEDEGVLVVAVLVGGTIVALTIILLLVPSLSSWLEMRTQMS